MLFDLPTSVSFGGKEWDIDPDFRQVLRILEAMEDPDLTDGEKATVCLVNLYVDVDEIPPELAQAAFDAAIRFIDHGSGDGIKEESRENRCADHGAGGTIENLNTHRIPQRARNGLRTMDWTQDAPLIFPAVNRAAGFEVRSVDYMHWWTFLGFFMEIKDSVYSTVLGLRAKRARHKPLDKHEQEFWNENRGICRLRERLTAGERAEKERLESVLGERKVE